MLEETARPGRRNGDPQRVWYSGKARYVFLLSRGQGRTTLGRGVAAGQIVGVQRLGFPGLVEGREFFFYSLQGVEPRGQQPQLGHGVRWIEFEDAPSVEYLAAVAEKGDFDLIVMGSHGHGNLMNLVMGSVTNQVLARSKAPVLLVR